MDKNIMPYSLEAEQSLLGCMLIDNEILPEILNTLTENDFYVEAHQDIIRAIKHVYAERKPVDIVTLADSLESACAIEKSGGISYITDLTLILPSTANYKAYYDIVKRDSINRQMIRASREIADFATKGHDADETVRFAEEKVYGIAVNGDSSAFKDVSDGSSLDRVLEKFQKLSEDKNAYRGVATGINRLDRLTNGLQKTNLIVLAARPGMGKTSLAMNTVEHAAVDNGKVCAVFSLEMSEDEITQRLLCSTAGVSLSAALSGNLGVEEWKRIIKADNRIRQSKIIIDDSSLVTPAEIRSKCRRIKAKNGGKLDLVMIDYIQLMTSGRRRSGDENRTQEVASITRDLKIMAKELDVPVLALSQLRRMSGEPQLSDLRESGAIEQDADIVMFIYRPDVNATDEEIQKKQIVKGMAYLNVAKNRNGSLEKIPLRFKGEITKFVNPEPNEDFETRAERK